MIRISIFALSFAILGQANAQSLYVRGDVIGNWTSADYADPNGTSTKYEFDGSAVGGGIRAGFMYGGNFIPFVKTGTELRLSYAPIKETQGGTEFSSGLYAGIFQRAQLNIPVTGLTPYIAIGTAGAAKTFEANSGTFKSSNFELKTAGAIGAELQLPGSKWVLGLDASMAQEGPKLVSGSLGYNF